MPQQEANDFQVNKLVIHFDAEDGNGLIYWICTGSGIETWINGVHINLSACDYTNNMPREHIDTRYGPNGAYKLDEYQYNLVKNWAPTQNDQYTRQQILETMWQGVAPMSVDEDYDSDTTVILDETPKINIRF